MSQKRVSILLFFLILAISVYSFDLINQPISINFKTAQQFFFDQISKWF